MKPKWHVHCSLLIRLVLLINNRILRAKDNCFIDTPRTHDERSGYNLATRNRVSGRGREGLFCAPCVDLQSRDSSKCDAETSYRCIDIHTLHALVRPPRRVARVEVKIVVQRGCRCPKAFKVGRHTKFVVCHFGNRSGRHCSRYFRC